MSTKTDIVDTVRTWTGVKKKDVEKVIDATLQAVAACMQDGEDVQFTGFGRFRCVNVEERTAHSPQTGEPITVPAHKAVRFIPGKTLKAYVNKEEN